MSKKPCRTQVVEPPALPLPVVERLALVELRHPELVEDERAAAPELELRLRVEIVGQADAEPPRLRGGQVQRLHVVGDDLVDDEPVRPDAHRRPHGLDAEVSSRRSIPSRSAFCQMKRNTSSGSERSAMKFSPS